MPDPVRETSDGILLTIRVIPRAKRSEIAGLRGEALLVRLAAPPVDGAANAALIDALADVLHLPRTQLAIAAGERSRLKTVSVVGLSVAEIERRLAGYGVIGR
jgi:uncharacterized protein (TIGR00251 family)